MSRYTRRRPQSYTKRVTTVVQSIDTGVMIPRQWGELRKFKVIEIVEEVVQHNDLPPTYCVKFYGPAVTVALGRKYVTEESREYGGASDPVECIPDELQRFLRGPRVLMSDHMRES